MGIIETIDYLKLALLFSQNPIHKALLFSQNPIAVEYKSTTGLTGFQFTSHL